MSQDGEEGMAMPGPGPPGGMMGQRPPQPGGMMGGPRPQQYQTQGAPRPPGPGPVRFQGPQSSPYMAPALSSTMPPHPQSVSRSPSQGTQIRGNTTMASAPPPRSASGPAISAVTGGPPDVDLSNLSQEERDIIESVMARAKGIAPEEEPVKQ